MWFPAVSFGSACIWPFEARPAPFDEIAARANPIPFRSAVGSPATVEQVGFQTKIKFSRGVVGILQRAGIRRLTNRLQSRPTSTGRVFGIKKGQNAPTIKIAEVIYKAADLSEETALAQIGALGPK